MSLEIRFTLPNQTEQVVRADTQRMLIGTLLSNEVAVRAAGVDPIHAMIEYDDGGERVIIDLGSSSGVKLNGKSVEVESRLKAGDRITVGSVDLHYVDAKVGAAPAAHAAGATPPPPNNLAVTQQSPQVLEPSQGHPGSNGSGGETRKTTPSSPQGNNKRKRENQLFSPRKAQPRGDVLEVVSYWGDTILDVELFHKDFSGYEACTIGDPTKAHMLAGGKEDVQNHLFAVPRPDGYRLYLRDGMKARIRKGGQVYEKNGKSKIRLGMKDIAHITYDAVKYFVMYVKPPALDLPPNRSKDPLFLGMLVFTMFFYVLAGGLIFSADKVKDDDTKDDPFPPALPDRFKTHLAYLDL